MSEPKLIYENDMPPKGRPDSYWKRRGRRCNAYNKANAYRFKTDGVTDNRRAYYFRMSQQGTNREARLRKVSNKSLNYALTFFNRVN